MLEQADGRQGKCMANDVTCMCIHTFIFRAMQSLEQSPLAEVSVNAFLQLYVYVLI